MIKLLGSVTIYTVPEVNAIIDKRTSNFRIVDKLPDITLADKRTVYYVRTGSTVTDDNGNTWPEVKAFIVGTDKDDESRAAWYTPGVGVTDYTKLKNLPTVNGEVFQSDMDEDKARGSVSDDGISGGYDLSIHDEDIIECVKEAYD